MAEICVVHLVRAQNGIGPLARFLASYETHPAGVDHDLLLVLKGPDARYSSREYAVVLDGLAYQTLGVADRGFDVVRIFTRHTR